MSQHLKTIQDFIQQNSQLSQQDKEILLKALNEAGKEFSLTEFKLDRTEKVKRTTAILLEETIEELEQKRKAVEAQNRDLKIESSLERVRTVAMGMKKPADMLDVCKNISDQLGLLKVEEVRNVQTAIINESKETYLNYEYFCLEDKTAITEVHYNLQPDVKAFVTQMLADPEAFFTTTFEGAKLKEWLEYQEKSNQFVDPHLYKVNSLHYYFYSIGPGALGVSTYSPLNADEIALVKRFRNVFELAYRRFIDIELAIAQAREAQIELALERVRARTMAMQNSDELADLVSVLFKELTHLDFVLTSCIIWINNPELSTNTLWVTSSEMNQPAKPLFIKPFYHSFFKSINRAWKAKDAKWIYTLSGEEKYSFEKAFFNDVPDLPDALKTALTVPDEAVFSASFNNFGALEVLGTEPLSDEKFKILHRFGKVFDSSYTRFNDLKQAEAQAREAQIQLALERVRARAMAMQKSEDLANAVAIVFEELDKLDMGTIRCGISIINKENHTTNIWSTTKTGKGTTVQVSGDESMDIHPLLKGAYAAWLKQEDYSYLLQSEDLVSFYTALSSTNFKLPDSQFIDKQSEELQQYCYVAHFPAGGLYAFRETAFTEEARIVIKRFAEVFNQTYTRYNDLKQAEAQAREAKIEAALERVRSRSLAMHKSDEIKDVVATVMEKMTELNIEINGGVSLVTFTPDSKDFLHWFDNPGHISAPLSMNLPYFDDLIFNDCIEAKEKGMDLFAKVYSFEEKAKIFGYAFEHSELKNLPEDWKNWVMEQPYFGFSFAIQKNSGIFLNDYTGKLFSEKENEILKRFAKVFEQAYVRFLDLQKAEAQAREAKIEAALERVRARAMGMHHSDELSDVLSVLFDQFDVLGISPMYTFLSLIDPEKNRFTYRQTGRGGKRVIAQQIIDLNAMDVWKEVVDRWKAANYDTIETMYVPKELVPETFEVFGEIYATLPEGAKVYPEDFPDGMYATVATSKFGHLGYDHFRPSGEDEKSILLRFNTEFVRLYQRFLDLQKSEAQSREAQIELGLERVRARTMAMHKSEELSETSAELFHELKRLGIQTKRSGFGIYDEKQQAIQLWLTATSEQNLDKSVTGTIPFKSHPAINENYNAWKANKSMLVHEFVFEEVKNYYEKIGSYLSLAPQKQYPGKLVFSVFFFSEGSLNVMSDAPMSEVECAIMFRFAKVFDQTYRRYLDLQKAEAQAREGQIQLALERVRARAMAMQSSDELSELVAILFEELTKLDLILARCIIWIFDNDTLAARIWMANSEDKKTAESYFIKHLHHPYYEAILKGWKEKNPKWVYDLKGKDKKSIDQLLLTETELSRLPEIVKTGILNSEHTIVSGSFNNFGLIEASGPAQHSDEQLEILNRFGKVFDLSYTRFNDLKQAEAQAREAKIEASLERVRAKTMAMHSSDDVGAATATMFTELEKLGIENVRGGILNIRKDQTMEVWSVNTLDDGTVIRAVGTFDMTIHSYWQQLYKGWENKDEFLYYLMAGKEKEDYIRILNARPDYLPNGIQWLPDCHVQSYSFGEGMVWTFSMQPHTEKDKQVMKRFASVFSLTFRRYHDLKKAEAQAREATIEAAMEKVRSRALAMQKPNELVEVAQLLRKEMGTLGVEELETSSIYIHNEATGKTECWYAIKDNMQEEKLVSDHMTIDLNDTWVGREMLRFYNSSEKQVSVVMKGSNRKEWIEYCYNQSPVLANFYGDNIPDRTYHLYKFSNGYMGAASPGDISAESWDLLQRATSVFSLAYTRFGDLQQTEASAKEAIRQAALDRVRAEIASMRTTTDLEKITPLIWNELTILGIPFIRCGVFIMDDEHELIHTFLSTPDGKGIAAFHLPYTTPGNIAQVLSRWHDKKNYIDHWDESAFIEFASTLVKQGALASPEQYLKTIPRGGFYLHFLPFLQGMLYVGNSTQLGEEEIKLIQSVAAAFSTAYARYEDFNKLEAAKKQVDSTLNELQVTQKQLIQSEKMASLGELTAGIAHEIQNPLNFVNNFSEVSSELLDEMITGLKNNNKEDAIAIADDVKQNLEKILHHGKRADSIVKGMLQHSRSSSAVKEPTDINKLADEYLRLAYHGLRAKDKSFNATLKTDYDETIGSINIIPQDIGRAILNLITNAFYAVTEKKKSAYTEASADKPYEPTVSVSTKKIGNRVEIKVKDNGKGIPQKVLDKIFQPFFTTKPTGQGTGLGLSLSYDIVKTHGGEIIVNTEENEGSEFIITLPLSF